MCLQFNEGLHKPNYIFLINEIKYINKYKYVLTINAVK